MKKPLIILTGPTAVGKSDLSIKLAGKINGEIISADSMQIYKYMDIGTAKIPKDEMGGINHYLIDDLEPSEEFNVYRFRQMALNSIEQIYSHNKIPIVVGGTGFYIQALLYDIEFTENDNLPEYRAELESLVKDNGNEFVYSMLKNIDPESAEKIHCNDIKRVIRALVFYKQTGMKISEHNRIESEKQSPYSYKYFVLNMPRDLLYSRIDMRVDKMFDTGLVDEVKALTDKGYSKDMVSMKGLGYKEIIDYFENNITLEEAKYIIKRDTRHFAKRQITWFKREKDVIWVNKDNFEYDNELILDYIYKQCLEVIN